MDKVVWIVLVVLIFMLAACDDGKTKIPYSALPAEGDPVRGETLYHQENKGAPACDSCHKVGDDGGSPDLTEFGFRADKRVEGMSAREYAFYSIAEPGKHLVPEYGNAMFNKYDDKLSAQDIADLIAYILTL